MSIYRGWWSFLCTSLQVWSTEQLILQGMFYPESLNANQYFFSHESAIFTMLRPKLKMFMFPLTRPTKLNTAD